MNTEDFRKNRRQKFLTLQYYQLNQAFLKLLMDTLAESMSESKLNKEPDHSSAGGVFKDKLKLLKLHYTAGCSIKKIHIFYTDLIKSLGEWHDAYREYIQALAIESGEDLRNDGTPLEFEDLYHFQLTLDVVSLGVLLGDGDALRKISLWVQRYRNTDILYDFLIDSASSQPSDTTEYFHSCPYDPLIDALYALENPAEASAKVKEYLDGWYKSFEGAPWHDGHLHAVEGEYMPYYGYWSFEAAAVCVIHGIDDSSFRDHILYPKDLADWARQNHSLERLKPGAAAAEGTGRSPQRTPGGESCPQAGWWYTLAQSNSRRYFQAGDLMPVIEGSAYGQTFWLWDADQASPQL